MNIRREDREDQAHTGANLKITREIPLWGILSVVTALGGQAVSTYYGQQKLTEHVEQMRVEVRALTTQIGDMRADQRGLQVQLEGLERRVGVLESITRK